MSVFRTTLGEVVDFTNGGAWNPSEYVDSGIPVVRVSDIHDETVQLDACKYLALSSRSKYQKHLLRTGDVVVATVGSHPTQPGSVVGRAAKVPAVANGGLLNQNAVCLRPSSGSIDVTYLRYLAVSQYFRDFIIAHARGSANQVRMAISLLKEMPLCLPQIERQREIGRVLSAYDDLIENNTRRIKILEQMAQMLYREWFVKFRFPGNEKVKLVESEMGLIPDGWSVQNVGEVIARLKARRTYREADVSYRGDIPVVDQSRDEFLGFHCNPPDLAASTDNPIAIFGDHTCKMRLLLRPFSIGPNVVPFSSNQGLPLIFVFFLVRGLVSTTEYKRHWNDLTSKAVIVAENRLAEEFTRLISPLLHSIDNLREKNMNLRTTRDLLLPKLVCGEVSVEQIEKEAVAKMV